MKADAAGLTAIRDGIDREFSLKLPADAVKKTATVGQLIDRVEKALKNRKPEKPKPKPPEPPPSRLPPSGGVRPG